jgi:cytoskeletal protein RodZ
MDIGAELRAAREAKGLDIRTLSERTRVQPRTLAAIELNNLSALPPRPFGRGFVRAFAQEVDLDPDRIVNSYFSQFPPSPPPPPPETRPFELSADALVRRPSPWAGLGTAAAILFVVVAAAVVIGRRNEPGDTQAVGTSGVGEPAPATSSSAQPAAATAPATNAPLRLGFTVSRQCWIAASVDGKRVLYRILEPGERQTLEAQKEIAIRFGDAGAVSWTINGRDGGPLGAAGAVRDLRITPEELKTKN